MKKGLLLGITSALLIGVVALAGHASQAAGNKYNFTVRGIVKEVDSSGKNVNVYTTHASAKAINDLAGNRQDFNVKSARIYKWANGKKKRVTLGSVVVGDEVVMKGVAKDNDTYNVSEITVNDRSFEVIGTLQGIDTSNHTVTIQVSTSLYNEAKYKGEDVLMHYDDNTQFMSLGKVVNDDEVPADQQRVKVKGFVNNGSTWNVTSFWDNYTAKK